ncbi:MAG: hypothetical protein LUD03_04280 [Firmicutes bacterium]|nr:hypothetical protein [Bacillota bacterium]
MLDFKRKTSNLQRTAFMSILIMLAVILYSMIMFMMNISMSVYSIVIPIAGIAVYCALFDRKLLYSLLLCLALLGIWVLICMRFTDYSYDGMYYHKEAVITLAKGWNPLYQSCTEAEPLNSHADLALWLDHYPKGIWIFSAAIYLFTNYIETAKAVNILFLIMLYCSANDALRSIFKFSNRKCSLLSLLICVNPLFINQLFTSYNDLAVGTLIMTTVFLGMKIYSETATNTDYALLFSVTAMSCLVKFTAPLLVGVTLIAYGTAYLIKHRGKQIIKLFKKPALVILIGFLTGVVIFGFDPYIKHIINGQNIVYPVLGENSYDIMNTNPPAGFDGLSNPEKLAVSLFSRLDNVAGGEYKLKIPFTVYASEFEHLGDAEIRLSGFGLLFSGILTVSVLLAAAAALIYKRKMRIELAVSLILFTLLGIFFPESWWARYASYIYYIPLFLMIYVLETEKLKIPTIMFALLIAANSVITSVFVIRSTSEMTAYFNDMLDEIKAEDKKVEIRINDFPAHLVMFEEKGIEYQVANNSIADEIVFYRDTKFRYMN